MDEKTELKNLIREAPHWMIRYGTSILLMAVAVLLFASSQIMLSNTVSIPLEFGAREQTELALFTADQQVQLSKEVEVRIAFGEREKIFQTQIKKREGNTRWLEIPEEVINANINPCTLRGAVILELGQISLFQKWYQSLFTSFTKS